jgi:hypothetical protein
MLLLLKFSDTDAVFLNSAKIFNVSPLKLSVVFLLGNMHHLIPWELEKYQCYNLHDNALFILKKIFCGA